MPSTNICYSNCCFQKTQFAGAMKTPFAGYNVYAFSSKNIGSKTQAELVFTALRKVVVNSQVSDSSVPHFHFQISRVTCYDQGKLGKGMCLIFCPYF